MVEIKRRTGRDHGRQAFTLVELMVVVAIMGILAALTAGAVILYMNTQRVSNTRAFLGKFNTALNKQYQAAKNYAFSSNVPIPSVILNMAGTDNNATARARIIFAKAVLKQRFPMSFAEALNPTPLPALPAYVTYLSQHGVTAGNTPPLNFESSACLLMALQRSDSGTGNTAEDLGAGGSKAPFQAGGGSIDALVDGWGNPLQFCRWPSGSPQLNPGGPQAGFNDPLDTQGLLNNQAWQSAYGQTFQSYFHPLASGSVSYRLAPLVASAGPDGIMGLNWDMSVSDPNHANDDMYSTGN